MVIRNNDALELDDIQGIVLRLYPVLTSDAAYVFVNFRDAANGRAWLRQVATKVTTVSEWDQLLVAHADTVAATLNLTPLDTARLALYNPSLIGAGIKATAQDILNRVRERFGGSPVPATEPTAPPVMTVNVGLTHAGLQALGRPEWELESFPRHFKEGMVAQAPSIADVGRNSPVLWDGPFRPASAEANSAVHAVLMVHADTRANLQVLLGWHDRVIRDLNGAVRVLATQTGARLPDKREHFGFRDGFGTPYVKGDTLPHFPGQDAVQPGEFVLGYHDEEGRVYDEVLRPDWLGEDNGVLDRYLKNGSFMAYRKLHQDVFSFRRFLSEKGGGNPELLAAKMVGRWRSGAPLALSAESDSEELAGDYLRNNDFDYADDTGGERVPVGSHIRRINPRSGGVIHVNRHRVMRRGIPYGDPLPEDAQSDDGQERGVIFLFLCASLRRQFLFVQQAWVNDSDFDRRLVAHDRDQDPLIGNHEIEEESGFTIPGGTPSRITGMPTLVTTKGGEFFFLPGQKALDFLATPTA